MIRTNDIKKGARIRLRNGWEAVVQDNKRGNIRLCRVFGIYDELGSTYAHDWTHVQAADGSWQKISHEPKQQKARQTITELFG